MDRAACYSGRRYASASVKTPWRSRNYDALKGTELMDKRDRGAGIGRPKELSKYMARANRISENLGERAEQPQR